MTGLEDYIVDNPFNKNNLDTLINSFKRETFVPFIGAGPSTVLGSPDWDELITNLCTAFNLKQFRKLKQPNGKVNYPKTFSNLFKKLDKAGITREQSYKKLFHCIKPTKTEATWFHLKLVDLFSSYITTNYDSPIEKAFENQRGRQVKKYFFSCYGTNNLKECIVYLHGHKEINFCIIKTEDYDYFYPTVSKKNGIPILEDFLSEIFINKNVIFIGFSFDDLYIENFLSHLHATKPFNCCHYWLLSESLEIYREIMQRADKYKETGLSEEANAEISNFFHGKMNVKPIVYKENEHIFIEKLFQKLIESLPVPIESGEISGTPVR